MSHSELESYIKAYFPSINYLISFEIQDRMIWVLHLHGGRESLYIPLSPDPPIM